MRAPSLQSPIRKMKILIIDDQPTELKLAHLVLSAAGHAVNDAEAAEEAAQAIKKDRPEVILLDMSLPGRAMSMRMRSGGVDVMISCADSAASALRIS